MVEHSPKNHGKRGKSHRHTPKLLFNSSLFPRVSTLLQIDFFGYIYTEILSSALTVGATWLRLGFDAMC